jgi:hypothetical protein
VTKQVLEETSPVMSALDQYVRESTPVQPPPMERMRR